MICYHFSYSYLSILMVAFFLLHESIILYLTIPYLWDSQVVLLYNHGKLQKQSLP
jgi:hypothetical protein